MELSLSDFRWVWVVSVVGSVVVLLLAWWGRSPRPRPSGPELPVARGDALRALPRYQQLVRRERHLAGLAVVGSLLMIAGATVVLARPQAVVAAPRESRARDIMLCLDASASMDDDNAAVVRELRRVIEQLEGDRIGMAIWSSATVLVFPLTDDYDYVRAQLNRAEAAFTGKPGSFYAGVDLPDAGASLIGDGIVSCADRFDRETATARTRVLIVASDNDPLGTPAYTVAEAAALAKERRILLYAIGAASLDEPDRADARQELADAAVSTGGVFAVVGQDDGARVIGDRIGDLARARSTQSPRTTSRDAPLAGALVAVGGLALLAGAWVARRRPR